MNKSSLGVTPASEGGFATCRTQMAAALIGDQVVIASTDGYGAWAGGSYFAADTHYGSRIVYPEALPTSTVAIGDHGTDYIGRCDVAVVVFTGSQQQQ